MELNIGGHDYKIIELPLKHDDDDKELYGRHMVKENIIMINEDIHDSRKKETLLHEILHAVFYNYGLQHKEGLIDAISNGMFQLGVGGYLWKKRKNLKSEKNGR